MLTANVNSFTHANDIRASEKTKTAHIDSIVND
mgnify:CR=1 FL=1